MAFDPDAYLAQNSQPSFDPDAYLAGSAIGQPKPSRKDQILQRLETKTPANKLLGGTRAALQGATLGFADELGSGLAALGAKGAQKLGFIPDTGESIGDIYSGMQSQIDAEQRQYAAENPKTALALEVAGSVPTIVAGGSIASGTKLLGQAASKIPGAAKAAEIAKSASEAAPLLAKFAKGAAVSAPVGAIYGAGTAKQGERVQKAKEGGIIAGAAGGALPIIGAGLGRVISTKASQNKQVQKLLEEGVTPTVGQTLGGAAGRAEEKAMSLPIFGDMIKRARNMTADEFQKAAFNRALKPIGQKMPKGKLGREAIAYAEQAISSQYDDVLNKIGAIAPDEQFYKSVDDLSGLVNTAKMPDAEMKQWGFMLDKVRNAVDDNGIMTSDRFKKLESELTSATKKLTRSDSVYSDDMAQAVRQLRENLRSMLSRQSGDNSAALKKANEAWANFKILQKAASGAGATDGNFTAKQLAAAVKAADASKSKGAYARGSALMQDLSDAGASVVSDKVPNSGTFDRLALGGGALASGAISPAVPVSLATGGALYTKPIQRALVNALAKRPEKAAELAARLNAIAADESLSRGSAVLSNRLSSKGGE